MIRHSCIYEGRVWHRRKGNPSHEFRFSLAMLYIDLDELPALFRDRWLWSSSRPNVAWFRRRDYLAPHDVPLADAVRNLVSERTGQRPKGAVRLLTHPRYFGFVLNPLSLYYCFDDDEQLQAIVADVTNTPWGERHAYVLDMQRDTNSRGRSIPSASKELHVSPFLPMDLRYEFRFAPPGAALRVAIAALPVNSSGAADRFDATLLARRRAWSANALAATLVCYPAMTLQIVAAIYWQALRLWWKGARYVPHPRSVVPGSRRGAAHGLFTNWRNDGTAA